MDSTNKPAWVVAPPYEGAPTIGRRENVEVSVPAMGEKHSPAEPCIQIEIEQGDGGTWSDCNHSRYLTQEIPISVLTDLLSAHGYSITKH